MHLEASLLALRGEVDGWPESVDSECFSPWSIPKRWAGGVRVEGDLADS